MGHVMKQKKLTPAVLMNFSLVKSPQHAVEGFSIGLACLCQGGLEGDH